MQDLGYPYGHLTARTLLVDLLEKQDRAISRAQLLECGIGPKTIARLVRDGWLHRRYRGVYVAGSPQLTARGAMWAAHLLSGGVVSHRSAAELHELVRTFWRVELIVPEHRRAPQGLIFHQSRLPPTHISTVEGLAVTTVARTLLDLADVVNERQLERALNQAEVLNKLDHSDLQAVILQANGRRGITLLRHALDVHALGLTLTRSELEERFLALVRERGFVQPEVNATVEDFTCDFVWRTQRVVVETDGAAFHRQVRDREQDAHRDRILRRQGWTLERLTYRQVFFRPQEVELILEGSGVPRAASPRRRPPARRRRLRG